MNLPRGNLKGVSHSITRVALLLVRGRYSGIVAAGLLLRLLVMPFSIGFDITLHTWISNLVAQGHIDVYRYYFEQFHTIYFLPNKPIEVAAGFPPLFYLLDGLYLLVLRSLHVLSFLRNWPIDNIFTIPMQNRVFFFMKALYIPFDLVGLVAFLKLFDERNRRTAAWAWMFNPLVIYVSYIWGQTDLMAATFIITAAYLAKKSTLNGKLSYGLASCISIGISASFKLFPLALLPVFSLILSKHTKRSIFYFVGAGLSPFLLAIPFISTPFIEMTIPYGNYLTSRNFSLGLPQFTIYFVFAAYLVILYYLYIVETDYSFDSLLVYSLATFTLLYGLSVWLPNWILWGTPLILLVVIRRPRTFLVYAVMLAAFFVFVQGWSNGIWLGMFKPLSASLISFPNLWDLIPRFYRTLIGLSYTAIGVSMLFVIYSARRHTENGKSTRPWQWLSLLLIPVLLALGTLILGAGYIHEHGLPLFGTAASSIASDPAFFAFYFVIMFAISVWAMLAAYAGRTKESMWRRPSPKPR